MLKFGFELEFFLKKDDQFILVPSALPMDECGWLVEVRSEPHSDIDKAIALLKCEVESVRRQTGKLGLTLIQEPTAKIPRYLKVQAARLHTKGLIKYKNVYGHETHRCKTDTQTASLHISVTNEHKETFAYEQTSVEGEYLVRTPAIKQFASQGFVDHAKLIVGMDTRFAAEIKEAGRNPGFYEVKSDGRIEYRSLPNNIDLDKVADALKTLKL